MTREELRPGLKVLWRRRGTLPIPAVVHKLYPDKAKVAIRAHTEPRSSTSVLRWAYPETLEAAPAQGVLF